MADGTKSSVLNLDRKAMEEARLKRLAQKRTADQGGFISDDKVSKIAKLQSSSSPFIKSISIDHKDSPIVIQDTAAESVHKENSKIDKNASMQYPFGAIKRTWAQGYLRNNDIKFEELLQKDSLNTAMISSWQWDFDWLGTKIDTKRTKYIFVMEAKTAADKHSLQGQFAGLEKVVRLCFPPMRNHLFARMHSKLMLLFHPGHLRLVVPSANPTRHDWGESGLLENLVFVIDLPRLEPGSIAGETTVFQKELLQFLNAMCLPEDVKEGVRNFDFSNTTDLRFVHSIPGSYNADDTTQSGLAGLSEAVRSMKLETPADQQIEVDVATASVGSLDETQISQFCKSLRGLDLYERAKAMKTTSLGDKRPDSFRVIFPSEHTVRKSKGGADAGGTIFLKKSAFEKASFPADIFHEYVSTRPGLLSHNKLILIRTVKSAYLYTGSANLSQSAWGKLTVPKSSQRPKLDITNWECGVLVPASRASVDTDGIMPYSAFEKSLDIPFACPPEKYEEGRRPWLTE